MYRWVNRQMFARHSLFVLPHEKRMLERNMKKECPLLNLCCKCFGPNCLNHRWLM